MSSLRNIVFGVRVRLRKYREMWMMRCFINWILTDTEIKSLTRSQEYYKHHAWEGLEMNSIINLKHFNREEILSTKLYIHGLVEKSILKA